MHHNNYYLHHTILLFQNTDPLPIPSPQTQYSFPLLDFRFHQLFSLTHRIFTTITDIRWPQAGHRLQLNLACSRASLRRAQPAYPVVCFNMSRSATRKHIQGWHAQRVCTRDLLKQIPLSRVTLAPPLQSSAYSQNQ